MEHLRPFFFPAHDGLSAPTLEAFFPLFVERARGLSSTVDRAIAAGALAPTAGMAFAGGYQAALERLLGERHGGGLAALLVTEKGGNHPRAIAATIEHLEGGSVRVSGHKRWATGATLASRLFVAATEGKGEGGRSLLRLVEVPAGARGVTMNVMPPTPFAADVPHAEVTLDGVELPSSALLPGDGYEAYVKPFRTVEDLHVLAAMGGHLARLSVRHRLSPSLFADLISLLASVSALAPASPSDPMVHVGTHGAFSRGKQLFALVAGELTKAGAEAGARLERERPLFEVAQQARDQRLETAMRALAGSAREG